MKFPKSQIAHKRSLEFIPLGSQTFSKSYLQWPEKIAPLFIERGKGSKVWDVDGNQYTDYVNGLLSIILGHCDQDVYKAVTDQLNKGTIHSLNSTLEADIAEKITSRVPCAEMVRFGKNGSDATAGAIRIARSYTGRDKVAVCGYHGWQDWYIGSTSRYRGVPETTRNLTYTFQFNDITSLEDLCGKHEFAAIILEPMSVVYPEDNFLQKVKECAKKNGSVLVFDETITGFRFARGGAQELFDVTPDLATFGKGIANGFPLSVIAGEKELMRECEDIFFSFTMGGETLSLAAAGAVMDKLDRCNVPAHLSTLGKSLTQRISKLISNFNCDDFLQVQGHPSWSFLFFSDTENYSMWEIKTYWLARMLEKGLLSIGTHNLSYAHSLDDIDQIISAYEEIFPQLKTLIYSDKLRDNLPEQLIRPVFSVR